MQRRVWHIQRKHTVCPPNPRRKLEVRAGRGIRVIRRACERIAPQHLFSKKFFQGENRSINRSCAICARTVRSAGRLAWCRGDEFGTNMRLTFGCLWTNPIGAQAPTLHPQIFDVVHMVIHRCESMVEAEKLGRDRVGNRTRSRTRDSNGTEPAMGFGAVFCVRMCPVGYRFERCLMRAVSSWTWSYTLRRSVISLRIFLSAYMTVV